MKKLYLSITLFIIMILMFAVTMIPTQAASYDDPVSGQLITLDTQITMLNSLTLEQVFGQTDLVKTINVDDTILNNISEWDEIGVSADLYNGQFVFTPSYQYARLVNSRPNIFYSGDATFFYASYKTTDGQAGLVVGDDFYFTDFIGFHNGNGDFNQVYGRRTYANVQSNQTYIGIRTQSSSNFVEIKLSSIYVVNLTYNDIDHLTDEQIKYFLELYEILSLGITPSVYYDQGYDFGEDIGYDDGYNDGLVEGYFDGNSAYHQGIYEYDYLTGVPYLEGLETGYNNGVDYAVQENISILSIFELIFGVALNMLTFIITIDIFGISILSLISVLSLFVGVVWILKMIRG